MAIGGLDIGSTGAKLTVLSEEGRVLHTGYRDYPIDRQTHAHEVDAGAIWNTVMELLRAAAGTKLRAVGIASFGESFVLLDECDRVLMPTMMYTDPRGSQQAAQLGQALGAEAIADVSGALPHPMFSLPKLMWVQQAQPRLFDQVARVCSIGGYIAYMLTGEHVIDYSLATRTMGFDIRTLAFSQTIFRAARIDPALFGRVVETGSLIGEVSPRIASELGLQAGLRVVLSGHDQIAAAVGSGVRSPGIAANGAGTVECVTPVFQGIPDQNRLQHSNYPVVPFLGNTNYCCYAFSFAGGSLIEWFLRELALGPSPAAKARGENIHRALESGAPDEPTGILVLPHFAGAATPYMDTGSRGAILGLELTHTTADLYRAVMEGIACETALNLERLAEAGVRIDALNASGGCARSEVWLQMKADITGIPIRRLSIDESGTVGSILFAGVATGAYDDIDQAEAALVRVVGTYEPRGAQGRAYRAQYDRYRGVYEAVRPLMHDGEGSV